MDRPQCFCEKKVCSVFPRLTCHSVACDFKNKFCFEIIFFKKFRAIRRACFQATGIEEMYVKRFNLWK